MARTSSGRARQFAGAVLHGLSNRLRQRSYQLFPSLRLVDSKGYSEIAEAERAGGFTDILVDGEQNILAGQLTDIYERHLFVATCISYIAESFASVPLDFFSTSMRNGRTEREPADDHPIAKAFRWWNPHQSSYDAWEAVASWYLLSGVGYIAVLQSDDPRYEFELWPLMSPGVRPVRGRNGLLGYKYRVEGTETTLLPEEVIAIRSFSTTDRFGGMGKLFAGRRQLVTDLRAREWNDRLLQKGVHVAGMLEADDDMDPKKAKKIRDSFMKEYAGSSNAEKIMVLFGGLKYKPTTFAHRDIMWMEQLAMTKEDISFALGVSLEVLGARSPNRAAIEMKRKIFWEDTIKPIARRIEGSLNSTFLMARDPALVAEHDYSNVEALRPDRTEQVKAGQIAVSNGLYTINEYRSDVLGLEPIEGGDVALVGRGLAPLETVIEARPESPTRRLASRKSITKAEDDYLRAMASVRDQTERRLQSVVRRATKKMEGALVEAIEAGATDALVGDVETIMWTEGSKAMAAESTEELRQAMEKGGGVVNGAIGVEGSLALRNTAAEATLRNQTQKIAEVGRRMALDLRNDLAEGLAAGESETALKDRVSSFFRGERSNALTIARTETTRAVNASAKQALVSAYRKHGIETAMEWRTSQDELVRTPPESDYDHAAVHGTSIDPNTEVFVVSGEYLEYPGDRRGGSAGNTINCRCGTVPTVVNDPRKSGGRGRALELAREYLDEKDDEKEFSIRLSGTSERFHRAALQARNRLEELPVPKNGNEGE